jgi:DNA polymerase I
MVKKECVLLDITYRDIDEKSVIKLFLKEKNERYWVNDESFHPYLYITIPGDESNKNKIIKDLEEKVFVGRGEEFKILKIEDQKKKKNEEHIIKVYFNKVKELVEARKEINEMGLNKFEYDINFSKRYLIDKNLFPGRVHKIEIKDNKLIDIKATEEIGEIEIGSFDLETWAGEKFTIGKEPILMSSISTKNNDKTKSKLVSYNTKKAKGLTLLNDEEELIKELNEDLQKLDFIVTYNGDNFDFPYAKKRAEKYNSEFLINNEKIKIRRHGLDNSALTIGPQHVDAYRIMSFMRRTGAVNIVKLDLENVSEKVFGIKKEKLYPVHINGYWKEGSEKDLQKLVDYNKEDSEITLRIATEFLPLFYEISKLTSESISSSTRNSTSNMVEDLLLKESFKRGIIAENKPHEGEVNARMNNPIKGGFVKEPISGLHENIVVLDFASLYPSIIISHNISPETANCEHEECQKNKSPDGTWFCTKEKGLFSEILESMLKERLKLKKEHKKKLKKEGIDDRILFAKQWALKIILNSVYGYLGYPRARWYSREGASATTSWARDYIHKAINSAENEGFEVLYGDTDSTFLLMKDKTKKDVENFLENVNSKLPETMELELDGYYKRGIFVTKKEGGAAKKRYALMDEKENLKIVGFEYVRRDWCNLAKETQKKVIELVLKKGEPEEAAKYVREVVKKLQDGEIAKEDLAIITMLKRKPEDYDSIGPHVMAAKKAIERGKDVGVGSMLSFVITKGSEKQSISEKAELEEFVREGDYDDNYYIENQILPAVMKIVRELGYTKEDLLQGGKQSGLGQWF